MASLLVVFGQAVRRLRTEAGFSQESFADAIGVHRNYVGTVERGETNITLENIARVAKGLKQPIWMIFRELDSGAASTEPSAADGGDGDIEAGRSHRYRSSGHQLRVAERRTEVRHQVVELLKELGELEAMPQRQLYPRPKRKKRR